VYNINRYSSFHDRGHPRPNQNAILTSLSLIKLLTPWSLTGKAKYLVSMSNQTVSSENYRRAESGLAALLRAPSAREVGLV
jgi:hypothetical protein